MKHQSVKQLRSGVAAAIYLLKAPNAQGPSMALTVLEALMVKNGNKEKVHRRAHTRMQNGKKVRVSAS